MPFKPDDLTFELAVDPNLADLEAAVNGIGRMIDRQGDGIKGKFVGLFRKVLGDEKGLGALGGAKAGYEQGGSGAAAGLGAVGGIVGGALGGPAGAAVGSTIGSTAGAGIDKTASLFLGAVSKVLSGPAAVVNIGLGKLIRSFNELQGILGPLGIGFNALSSALETVDSVVQELPLVGSVLGPFTQQLTLMPELFKALTSQLVSFAGVANPDALEQYSLALRDVQGVIGQAFLPVLDRMREGVRLFGDVIANILPNSAEVNSALSVFRTAFAEMGKEIRSVMADVGPLIREWLLKGLRELAHWGAVAAKVIGELASRFRVFAGVERGSGGAGRTATGASAAPAQLTSFEDYRTQLQLRAFSQGAGKTDAQRTADSLGNLEGIQTDAAKILANIDQFWTEKMQPIFDQLPGVLEGLTTAINTLVDWLKDPKKAVESAAKAADEVTDKIGIAGNLGVSAVFPLYGVAKGAYKAYKRGRGEE